MNSELRITDTNSANDSKGRALGLDGNDFLYVVVGIVAGIGAFLALYSVCAVSLVASALVSACLVAAPTAWVLLFRRNRPDGYAEDFFDDLLNREGWEFAPGNQPAFPLFESAADSDGAVSASNSASNFASIAAPVTASGSAVASVALCNKAAANVAALSTASAAAGRASTAASPANSGDAAPATFTPLTTSKK